MTNKCMVCLKYSRLVNSQDVISHKGKIQGKTHEKFNTLKETTK